MVCLASRRDSGSGTTPAAVRSCIALVQQTCCWPEGQLGSMEKGGDIREA
eukprot:CAMPEP_0170596106 /NCGR_PEP_ID=MMETSP0224-20130122/14927_1 /TAXON_ID=285029 /ORGANISM="Togula jolla, Strain CCCM 725" /LENGTH=49 /DNA_ID= /DNA_START= /DNA_END= /DNA_ORIENTATION=